MGDAVGDPALSLDPVGPADADDFLALSRAMNAEDGHPLDAAGEAAARRVCAGDPMVRAWIARKRGRSLGYVVLTSGFTIEFGGRDGFIDELYVVPSARRRGLGRVLLDFAVARARELGIVALHLVVERRNERAAALYRRLGWRDSDRRLMTRFLPAHTLGNG